MRETHRRHEAASRRTIEITGAIFQANAECEGPEGFAVLHIIIEVFLHVRRPRGSEQAAIPKRSRAEFSRALKPGDDFARIQKFERCFDLSIF